MPQSTDPFDDPIRRVADYYLMFLAAMANEEGHEDISALDDKLIVASFVGPGCSSSLTIEDFRQFLAAVGRLTPGEQK